MSSLIETLYLSGRNHARMDGAMKRLLLLIGFLLPATGQCFVNLSGTFSEDSGY